MNWLCKLGLHDWVYVWDHNYTHICVREECTAFKRLRQSVVGTRRRRKIAIAKLRKLKGTANVKGIKYE